MDHQQEVSKSFQKLLYDYKQFEKSKYFYEDTSYLIQVVCDSIRNFVKTAKQDFVSREFMDKVVHAVQKKEIEPIDFLIELTKFADDQERLAILRYIFETFNEKQIDPYFSKFRYPFDDFNLSYINLLIEFNYDKLISQSSIRMMNSQKILEEYLKVRRSLIELEKENAELKIKIESLELEIKYMPGGEGYEEAKNDFFEILRTQ